MNDSGEFSEADFDACFKEFDKDGSGTIEKDEMAIFIKEVAGLWAQPRFSVIDETLILKGKLSLRKEVTASNPHSFWR